MSTSRGLEVAGDAVELRQKVYKTIAMMSGPLTGPLLFDWQRGQGFQSVPALHLHLLIKCHNNMIFNNQQAAVRSLRRAQERRAKAKVRQTAKVQRIHLFSVRAEVRETLQPVTARVQRGRSEGAAKAQQGCAVVQRRPVFIG